MGAVKSTYQYLRDKLESKRTTADRAAEIEQHVVFIEDQEALGSCMQNAHMQKYIVHIIVCCKKNFVHLIFVGGATHENFPIYGNCKSI